MSTGRQGVQGPSGGSLGRKGPEAPLPPATLAEGINVAEGILLTVALTQTETGAPKKKTDSTEGPHKSLQLGDMAQARRCK